MEPDNPRPHLLVLDASVAFNFIAVRAFDTLTELQGLSFTIPRAVEQQFRRAESRKQLWDVISAGNLTVVDDILSPDLLATLGEVSDRLGSADASVLVYGLHLQAEITTDDGRLRNEATRRGIRHIWRTEDLLAHAVLSGAISIRRANDKLWALADHHFMSHLPCLCEMCNEKCAYPFNCPRLQ